MAPRTWMLGLLVAVTCVSGAATIFSEAWAQDTRPPLIRPGSEVFLLLPVGQAKLTADERRFVSSVAAVYARDDFFAPIAREFQKVRSKYVSVGPQTEAIDLVLSQIQEFGAAFRGEVAVVSVPQRRVSFPAKGWANGVDSALRSFGYVLIDLNGDQIHPLVPPQVTLQQWEACSKRPITTGRWKGACRPSDREVLLPGLKSFK